MKTFTIEVTDTFSGEANYSWVRRYKCEAKSFLGAIQKFSKFYGGEWRKEYDSGDIARYNMRNACICCFVEWVDLDGWSDLGGVHYETIGN